MKKKILENKKIITAVFSLIIIILMIRISYAFYVYSKDTYDVVYNTGKIRMQLGELSDGITLSNQLPISDEDGVNQSTSYSFTVSGYTDSNKPIYYEVVASLGETIGGKTRFNEEDIKLYLTDNSDNILYGPDIAYRLSTLGTKMYANSIEGGSVLSPITNSYKLKLWISDENILISRTSTSTTKTVYTPEEYNSRYFSIKIKINSDVDSPKYAGQNILDIINTDLANNLYTPSGDTEQTFIVGTASDNNYKPNNYIWYSGKLWRIVALNKTGGVVTSIKVISHDNITNISWNGTLENGGSGGSVYQNSFAYQWLNEDFYNTLKNPNNYIVSNYNWNATMTTSTNIPPNTTMVSSPIGMLNAYEYTNSYRNTTTSNGYLNNNYYWWLITPMDTTYARLTTDSGTLSSADATSGYSIRPAINLKTSVGILKGNGSKDKPYVLVDDYKVERQIIGSDLNTRYSGEYVLFNNEKYRIVGIENNLTKIVKDDYIKNGTNNLTKGFATTVLYSQSLLNGTSYWGGYLNNTTGSGWYGTLTATNQNLIESGTWYLGTSGDGTSYKKSICDVVNTIASGGTLTSSCTKTAILASSKVGLLRVGEMFSSQVSNDYSPTNYYLLTPSSGTSVNYLTTTSFKFTTTPDMSYATRSVVYIKSSAFITSGDGTPNKPFQLGTYETIIDKINTDLASNLYTPSGDTDQTFIVGTASDSNYNPNNYLWYSGKLWRIVALNKTGGVVTSIKMTTQENITSVAVNGTLANGGSDGSTFLNSFAYQWLNEDFYDTLRNPSNYIVTNYSWNATQMTTGDKPPNTTMVTSPVGLLNMYEYTTSYQNTTYANGYLINKYQWALITPYSATQTNKISYDGYWAQGTSTYSLPLRPSINLKTNIGVIGGNGTANNPYRLAGDSDTESQLLNSYLNTRYSGEYVIFNDENYRIVNVEGGLTKLIKIDYVKDTGGTIIKKYFGTTSAYSQSLLDGTNYWGGYLNNTTASGWYGSMPEISKNMIQDNSWYFAAPGVSATSYKLGICATVQTIANGGTLTKTCTRTTSVVSAKIGLIRYGEMFATQSDLAGGYSTASGYWLINASGANTLKVDADGPTWQSVASMVLLTTRPSFYLNSNVYITDGDGTPSNPFTIAN